jgi:hypothetical protein
MPSKTPKQKKTMRAAAHNPEFADKVGIPQKVAREFERADEAKDRRGKRSPGKAK